MTANIPPVYAPPYSLMRPIARFGGQPSCETIADDGRGFDPAHTLMGAGLQNIRDRTEDLGGAFNVASRPGHGTVLTISLPWPAVADGRL